jgi:hypothetical protein
MVQRTVYLHIPNSLYVTSLWLLQGEACAWFLSKLVNIPYGKITCQLCMQHATYFTFSLWTALVSLQIPPVRVFHSTIFACYSHVKLNAVNKPWWNNYLSSRSCGCVLNNQIERLDRYKRALSTRILSFNQLECLPLVLESS